MSIRLRVLIVDRGDRVKRFPVSFFSRLHERGSRAFMPDFRNEWVRFAEIAVEMEDRKPLRIVRILFVRIRVGPDGRPDPTTMDDQFRLSGELTEPTWADDSGVLIGRSLWAKKKLKDRHRWEPSPFLERAIRKMALAR